METILHQIRTTHTHTHTRTPLDLCAKLVSSQTVSRERLKTNTKFLFPLRILHKKKKKKIRKQKRRGEHARKSEEKAVVRIIFT